MLSLFQYWVESLVVARCAAGSQYVIIAAGECYPVTVLKRGHVDQVHAPTSFLRRRLPLTG